MNEGGGPWSVGGPASVGGPWSVAVAVGKCVVEGTEAVTMGGVMLGRADWAVVGGSWWVVGGWWLDAWLLSHQSLSPITPVRGRPHSRGPRSSRRCSPRRPRTRRLPGSPTRAHSAEAEGVAGVRMLRCDAGRGTGGAHSSMHPRTEPLNGYSNDGSTQQRTVATDGPNGPTNDPTDQRRD